MRLEKLSLNPPPGAAEMLLDLGDGQNGFSGTSFGRGSGTLEEFLQFAIDREKLENTPPGFVPQTLFWMIAADGNAVGMMRVRHYLNERLIESGGHIGYYVRPSERGKGYATAALRLAVQFVKSLGIDRALVTTHPDNQLSARVVLANGGVLDRPGRHPDTGEKVMRYWVG